ncbi:hypothetical protein KCTCHS21_48900 [Cohnella abietis]|uniref:SLH domain-containing protein n=2 Tax=Cohnella abietis TaxID=2507935 RepID=A0A3T1DBH5_9BACL|nr:hypothetical protein KCTCHS21_48900 [Cohnella abietis]
MWFSRFIQQVYSAGDDSQLWMLEDKGGGYYQVSSKQYSLSLSVAGSSIENGANVDVKTDGSLDSQRWSVEYTGPRTDIVEGHYYKIINKKSGRALQVADSSLISGAVAKQEGYQAYASQKWRIFWYSNGYVIENKHSGKILESSDLVGGGVAQSPFWWDTSKQQWTLERNANGNYKLKYAKAGTGFVMQPAGGSTDAGTVIQTTVDTDDDAQEWEIIEDPTNDAEFVPGNKVANGGFEEGSTGWNGGVITTDANTGSKAILVGPSPGGNGINQEIIGGITPGMKYRLTFSEKAAGGTEGIAVGLQFFSASDESLGIKTVYVGSNSYSKHVVESDPAPEGTSKIKIWVWNDKATESLYIDDVSLVQVVAEDGNLIVNGGFEWGTLGWNGGAIMTDTHTGSKALMIEPGPGGSGAGQVITNGIVPGTKYKLTFWEKAVGDGGGIAVGIQFFSANDESLGFQQKYVGSSNYTQQIIETDAAPEGTAKISVWVWNDKPAKTLYLDDVYVGPIVPEIIDERNMIKNGGFESGTNSWQGGELTTIAHTGINALLVGPNSGVNQIITEGITPGVQYKLTLWEKATGDGEGIEAALQFLSASDEDLGSFDLITGSTSYTQQMILSDPAPEGTKKIKVWVWNDQASRSLYLDDVSVIPILPEIHVDGNMITNGGFESGLSGWEGGKLIADGHSGTKALMVEPGTGTKQLITGGIVPGTKNRMTFWEKAVGGNEGIPVGFQYIDIHGNDLGLNVIYPSDSHYTEQIIELGAAPENTAKINVWIWNDKALTTLYVDDFSVVAVPEDEITSEVTSIDISGGGSLSIPESGSLTSPYTAVVKDQNGHSMDGHSVTWAIYNEEDQSISTLSINGAGLLTVDSTAETGDYKIKVSSNTNHEIKSEKIITLLKDDSGSHTNTNTNSYSNPTTSVTSKTNTSIAGNIRTISIVAQSTTDPITGAVTAVVEASTFKIIVNQAKEAEAYGQKIVVEIKVEANTDGKNIAIEIPREALRQMMETTKADLKVATSFATILFNPNAVASINNSSSVENIIISIRKVDKSSLSENIQAKVGDRPVYDFLIKMGSTEVSEFGNNNNILIDIPYAPKAGEKNNAIVVYYIDNIGALKTIRSKYDPATGNVTFNASHFSEYVVGYNEMIFSDVAVNSWYSEAIDFISARGIVNGVGDRKFVPDNNITRADFLIMVMNSYGIKLDTSVTDNFSDAGSKYYSNYLGTAKYLGLVSGLADNKYEPEALISRQDMVVILHRVLDNLSELPMNTSGKAMGSFKDANDVAGYAKAPMKLFTEAGILTGFGINLFPKATATRAQAAQVLYNLLSI